MKNIFITGVDTDIGKTFISIGLLLANEFKGLKVGYFKPFQSGVTVKEGSIIAPDLYELKKYSNIPSMYSYLFKGEISPHLACLRENVEVDLDKIKNDLNNFSKNFDLTIIEGAGGFYCPCYKKNLFCDFIKNLQNDFNLETIFVTTPHLGRLNHTLMSLELAKINNINIKGLIINKMPKHPNESEKNFTRELKLFNDINIIATITDMINPNKQDIINAFKNINL